MTYTIYGDLRSGVFSSEAALAEAGADYTFERISIEKAEQKAPAFLAINPSGKMPALRLPDGTIVTESLAILLTIADRFPQSALLPKAGTPARANAYRWLAYMAGEIYPMVEISDYPERFATAGAEAEALRAKAQHRIQENLLVLERAHQGPWFLGEFSACDIYAAMFTRWRASIGRDWDREKNIPRLMALAELLSKRERIAAVWQKHYSKK
jgi:GST-like protein